MLFETFLKVKFYTLQKSYYAYAFGRVIDSDINDFIGFQPRMYLKKQESGK